MTHSILMKDITKDLRIIFICFVLFESLSLHSQTKISGHIPGAEGFPVRYVYFDDLVSNKNIVLFDTVVSESGDFSLEVDFDKTLFGKIELPFYYANIILEPDQTYELQFDSAKIHNIFRPFYQISTLTYKMLKPENCLDKSYKSISYRYNKFYVNNVTQILLRQSNISLDSIELALAKSIDEEDNLFLNQKIKYGIADIKLLADYANRKRADHFRTYIEGQKPSYDSPPYMDHFEDFFKDFFTKNRFFSIHDIQHCINVQEDFSALQDSIGKDSLVRDERLRELVTLINLRSLYHNKEFSKQGVLQILDNMKESKFPEHRKIANNLLTTLPRLGDGQKIPEFSLLNIKNENEIFESKNLLKKPSYLAFYNSHDINSVRQLDLLEQKYLKHQEKINFVTISLDEEFSTAQELYKLKNYSFPMLWNGWDWKLLDDYRIVTFPLFLSMDAEGKIVTYPEFEVDEIDFEAVEVIEQKEKSSNVEEEKVGDPLWR